MSTAFVSWRIGQDKKAHCIVGCDPNASGWIAECGRYITGTVQRYPSCRKCERLHQKKKASEQ
jgi:hypothetical protein